MLSKQAFNGLLKTLEEPPPSLKFILATTEVRKIPVTILSRCQRFDLKRVSVDQLMIHLKNISLKEKGNISDDAIRLIAQTSEGSVRDAISLLDRALISQSMNENKLIQDSDVREMLGLADRSKIILTQTPQAFDYKILFDLAKKERRKITDEASLFINNNFKIKFIKGENQNNKITYLDDAKETKTFFGIGFDIHRLVKNKKLYLGGIKIPFHSGLKGHSDGDVVLHAIIDAILGAIRKKDIGTYFPNTTKFRNIRSPKMLKPVIDNLKKSNFFINNLDINLICEKPKVSKYRDKIIKSITNLMGIDKDLVNLKGKTVEKLGLIGKEEAIACEVIISIKKYD